MDPGADFLQLVSTNVLGAETAVTHADMAVQAGIRLSIVFPTDN